MHVKHLNIFRLSQTFYFLGGYIKSQKFTMSCYLV